MSPDRDLVREALKREDWRIANDYPPMNANAQIVAAARAWLELTDLSGPESEDGSGEVPPSGSEARRHYLALMPEAALQVLARTHGADDMTTERSGCFGWGAIAHGVRDRETVHCQKCSQATTEPLWYRTMTRDLAPYCWKCALRMHLADCPRWGMPAHG